MEGDEIERKYHAPPTHTQSDVKKKLGQISAIPVPPTLPFAT